MYPDEGISLPTFPVLHSKRQEKHMYVPDVLQPESDQDFACLVKAMWALVSLAFALALWVEYSRRHLDSLSEGDSHSEGHKCSKHI